MTDQFQLIFLYACLIMGFLLLWAAGIAFTFWDASRRKLPATELGAWLILAAILPVIGGLAYLFSRFLSRLFSLEEPGSLPARKYGTLLKRTPQGEMHTGTLLADDLLQNTYASERPLPGNRIPAQPAISPDIRLQLQVIEGPHSGQSYAIYRLPAQIGRGQDVAVRLDQDLSVSRQHAEIYEREGDLYVRDLNSAHGTLLDGIAITDRILAQDDRIQVGVTTLLVQLSRERL